MNHPIYFKNVESRFRSVIKALCAQYLGADTVFEGGDGDNTGPEIDFSALPQPVRAGAVLDRVHALTLQHERRMSEKDLKVGSFLLDIAHAELKSSKGGDIIKLTDKESDLLETLYHAGPDGMDKQSLLSSVWGFVEGLETHTLETHVYRLRQKIEADPVNPEIILTNDVGYALSFKS